MLGLVLDSIQFLFWFNFKRHISQYTLLYFHLFRESFKDLFIWKGICSLSSATWDLWLNIVSAWFGEVKLNFDVLTVQAEGDVDDLFFREALQIRDQGTFEVCGWGGVSHMNPADSFPCINEVHGRRLFGAGGQQTVDSGATQGSGLDVLGIRYKQNG